jgi:hypothetical protein
MAILAFEKDGSRQGAGSVMGSQHIIIVSRWGHADHVPQTLVNDQTGSGYD